MPEVSANSNNRPHAARGPIRDLKRSIAIGIRAEASNEERQRARESAQQLLARSIRNGHRRLTLIRLVEAVRAGAPVEPEQWTYCEVVAAGGVDAELGALLVMAKQQRALQGYCIAANPKDPGIRPQRKGM